ncbi:hypothetical protein [Pseudomonas sp. KCJK8993]|uniref:hypothetical protein n=1 Tax=Pseudomonas sp. KCJK8993 TaxID=3344565 RepID=UPI003906A813
MLLWLEPAARPYRLRARTSINSPPFFTAITVASKSSRQVRLPDPGAGRLLVQVNAVAPGIVDPALHPTEPQTRAALQALAPRGRTGGETVTAIRRRERNRRG